MADGSCSIVAKSLHSQIKKTRWGTAGGTVNIRRASVQDQAEHANHNPADFLLLAKSRQEC